ncbi:hypothetical protein N657DRAFT_491168 [Parathielavia appendiculata]|uniref:Uncharacterized protein n=1 Tax=Parathielavia appendiculata TaxID=2587402 RepID=A0AAN6Z1H6_9PEZI|nr:hypothetical protein N657DRAFT_491168 [Parathielavia appendiculata]
MDGCQGNGPLFPFDQYRRLAVTGRHSGPRDQIARASEFTPSRALQGTGRRGRRQDRAVQLRNQIPRGASEPRANCQEMVSHFVFLYRADWRPRKEDAPPALWCVGDDGEKYRLSTVYIPSTQDPYSASSIARRTEISLRFIHRRYIDTFQKLEPDGLDWLENSLGIAKLIRLAQTGGFWGTSIHVDFKLLLDRKPFEALGLLRFHWADYSPWFETETGTAHHEKQHPARQVLERREPLIQAIRRTQVPCHGNDAAKLSEKALPRESLLALVDTTSSGTAPGLPECEPSSLGCRICRFFKSVISFPKKRSTGPIPHDRLLNIARPEDGEWDFLEKFGVVVKPAPLMFMAHFRRLRGSRVTHKQISGLYEQLEKCVNGVPGDGKSSKINMEQKADLTEKIRKLFREDKSISLPPGSGRSVGEWVGNGTCVWDGPECLRHVPRVKDLYGSRQMLFHSIFGMPLADLVTLHEEALHMVPSDTNHIVSVLSTISRYLGRPQTGSGSVPDLSSCALFPVIPAIGDQQEAGTVLRTSRDRICCIPKSQLHRDSLLGVVDMSVLSSEEFSANALRTLRERLDLGSHFVSKLQKGKASEVGSAQQHPSYERRLRDKAPYISELIPNTLSRETIQIKKELLAHARAYASDRIDTRLIFDVDGCEVLGAPIMSDTYTQVTESGILELYLVADAHALELGYPPVALIEVLAELLCMPVRSENDRELLTNILYVHDNLLIKKELETRKGRIPSAPRRTAGTLKVHETKRQEEAEGDIGDKGVGSTQHIAPVI